MISQGTQRYLSASTVDRKVLSMPEPAVTVWRLLRLSDLKPLTPVRFGDFGLLQDAATGYFMCLDESDAFVLAQHHAEVMTHEWSVFELASTKQSAKHGDIIESDDIIFINIRSCNNPSVQRHKLVGIELIGNRELDLLSNPRDRSSWFRAVWKDYEELKIWKDKMELVCQPSAGSSTTFKCNVLRRSKDSSALGACDP